MTKKTNANKSSEVKPMAKPTMETLKGTRHTITVETYGIKATSTVIVDASGAIILERKCVSNTQGQADGGFYDPFGLLHAAEGHMTSIEQALDKVCEECFGSKMSIEGTAEGLN